MKRIITGFVFVFLLSFLNITQAYAAGVPREETPDYKVAFYAFECYHMQDENGKKYGYGYDMMQDIAKHLQCTFSYIGYDKSAQECMELLRSGEVDIYTAAKKTPEKEEEFAFSVHPAITARTMMNVKRGNTSVVPGDYTTYNGLRIGLLRRHTYNNTFIEFANEKGFEPEIFYYETPTELSKALIDGEVDALVNSYIRTPEDELVIEEFGETPYYFIAKKENQYLIDQIDVAIDEMNIETPNWRSNLFNLYYGSQSMNTQLTLEEQKYLNELMSNHTVIKAVMRPDNSPYSWYENGEAHGIVPDIFALTANKLHLEYEIIPVSTKEEYEKTISSGVADIWMDVSSCSDADENYKLTNPYLQTSASLIRQGVFAGKIKTIGLEENTLENREIVYSMWPDAQIVELETTNQGILKIVRQEIDGMMLKSYAAQKIVREDALNRLTLNVVPGAYISLYMGVNAKCNREFYSIWDKALKEVSQKNSSQIVQKHLEEVEAPSLLAYMFDKPVIFIGVLVSLCIVIFVIFLYILSLHAKNRQLKISEQLSQALDDAKKATEAKTNFFSKMSHDIRTPLNAILGMTQIAKKYRNNPAKLDDALNNITNEGNYLLTMINSILDMNQLEHGHLELICKPFNLTECMEETMTVLRPLASKKNQTLNVSIDEGNHIVVGDEGRFSQIIVNVVSNAIKYTENGGHIDVKLESLSYKRFRFTCADNGMGMDEEFVKHICEEYSRAEDSRTSSIEGTGLGMAVVKGFTELMHGTLSIQSKVGVGSTFIIELPFEVASIQEREMILKAQDDEDVFDASGKKVLLVEDNALNAEIATELIESMGFVVDWAENGKVGVDKYLASARNEYYAIFMDMQMPVMDGIEATKQIRHMEREDHDIPIYAMTANTLEKDRISCVAAGMNGYITKPISTKEIQKAIQGTFLLS